MRKAFTALFIAVLLILSATFTANAAVITNLTSIDLTAGAAILMDMKSGQILWEHNADQRRAIASTTKTLTAIVALENAGLADEVTVSQRASDVGEAEIYLASGEKRTVEELLYAVMLKSANDGATALAEHVGGTVEGFVIMMNDTAQALGATNSHFANPHGLNDPGHYSTARDLSEIARYAMSNPKFREIVRTKKTTLPWPGHPDRVITNHNKLVLNYPGAIGIKTGYVRQSGYCLVSAAQRNGKELLAVVLGSKSSATLYSDTERLLNYGFDNYQNKKIISKGRKYGKVTIKGQQYPVIAVGNFNALVKDEKVSVIVEPSFWNRDVREGSKIGTIAAYIGNKRLGGVDGEIAAAKQNAVKKKEAGILQSIWLFFFGWLTD